MGIFDALNTAVGGLQSQSFALQNISGNIANASTTGYKGIDTTFEDLIPDATSPSRQVAGGVTAFAQQTITTQGTVSTTTVATNMAINGDGFFSVQQSSGTIDNVPQFTGVTDYTRRGDFQVNANGNLVNGAGYYLMGETVDPKTGNVTGSVPQVLQFQNNFIPSQTTTTIDYAANLPSTPTTALSSSSPVPITAAGGLNPGDFGTNPTLAPFTVYANNSISSPAAVVDHETPTAANITANTMLSGASGTISLVAGFANADSLIVDGQTISFTNTGSNSYSATGATLNVTTATVGNLLTAIDTITGTATASGVASGKVTLNTGTANDLLISGSSNAATAMLALGFTLSTSTPIVVRNSHIQAQNTPPTVAASDEQPFLNESISGGAVTAYDSTGTAVNLQLRWAKTDSASLGGSNTWNLFYQSAPSATGGNAEWTNVGTAFTFNTSGALVSPPTPSVTITGVAVGGQHLGTLSFNVASGSLTQYASAGGTATINSVTQNGYAAGQLQSVAINNNGIVIGTFSNGQNLDLASVTLSHFNGTNYLQALDGGAYAVTEQSGGAIQGASGNISGSSLEGSNTDIASEFTKLIVTQQAYSANTKIITTANSMIQDLLNVLR
jgi:flagellar hook protein FlgE